MKVHHLALWTHHLEEMKDFYCTWFGGECSEKYVNPVKQFESYFIGFVSGASLEIMRRPDITVIEPGEYKGYCHIAFDAGSEERVIALTEALRDAGYTVAGEPRTTGDGYFESVILDIDGNRIELVAG